MSADLESRLRDLPDRLAGLEPAGGLAGAVRSRRRRRRRLVVAGSVTAVLAVLGGGTVAVTTLRDAPDPAPAATAAPSPVPHGPLPTDPRLLRWPGRGPMVDDAAAVRAALKVAVGTYSDTGDPTLDAGPAHLLWIGPARDQGRGPEGIDRFAITQRYVTGERPGIYLQWLSGSASNRWSLRARLPVPAGIAGIGLAWSLSNLCSSQDTPCPPQDVRVLVLGAPDVTSVRYRFVGGPLAPAPVTDGVGLVTTQVDPIYADAGGGMTPYVAVTRRGRDEVAVAVPVPVRLVHPRDSTPAAVEWQPLRGLPPLLDAPQTFPALDLWGRLHGSSGRPGYGNPIWGGTLADGSTAAPPPSRPPTGPRSRSSRRPAAAGRSAGPTPGRGRGGGRRPAAGPARGARGARPTGGGSAWPGRR